MKLYLKNFRFVAALFVVAAFSTACTNAIPTAVVNSSLNLAAPTVNSSTTPLIIIPHYNSSVTISGTCTQLTTQLQISFDSGHSWNNVPAAPGLSAQSVACTTTGTFSFTIPDPSALGITGGLMATSLAGATEGFELMSTTSLGNSGVATVTLSLPPAYNRYLASLPAAGGTMNGSRYKIIGKFGSAVSTPALSGSSYKINLENNN